MVRGRPGDTNVTNNIKDNNQGLKPSKEGYITKEV